MTDANAEYQYAPDSFLDQPYSMIRDGAVFYYHYDQQGSVISMTNEEGHVVQRYEYDAFGNIVLQEGNIPNPFTYKGRIWDAEAEMYYFRARHYDPHTGRFAQKDPVLAVNPYVFVNNNPVNYGNPLGLNVTPYKIGFSHVVSNGLDIINSWTSVICTQLPGETDSANTQCVHWLDIACHPARLYNSDGDVVFEEKCGTWFPGGGDVVAGINDGFYNSICAKVCKVIEGVVVPSARQDVSINNTRTCLITCSRRVSDPNGPCIADKIKDGETKNAARCDCGSWACSPPPPDPCDEIKNGYNWCEKGCVLLGGTITGLAGIVCVPSDVSVVFAPACNWTAWVSGVGLGAFCSSSCTSNLLDGMAEHPECLPKRK